MVVEEWAAQLRAEGRVDSADIGTAWSRHDLQTERDCLQMPAGAKLSVTVARRPRRNSRRRNTCSDTSIARASGPSRDALYARNGAAQTISIPPASEKSVLTKGHAAKCFASLHCSMVRFWHTGSQAGSSDASGRFCAIAVSASSADRYTTHAQSHQLLIG